MKKIIIQFSLLILLFNTSTFAKNTDITSHRVKDVNAYLDKNVDLSTHPYLAISILFREFDNFRKKEFLGRFKKLKYLYLESTVTYDNQSQTEKAPLYFLKSTKGKFSTSIFEDKTIVRKLPVEKDSDNMPFAGIEITTEFDNQAIKAVKKISESVKPLIGNTTSVFGTGAPKLIFSFLNDAIGSLSEKNEVSVKVDFEIFEQSQTDISPFFYDVIFLAPADISFAPPNNMIIKKNSSNRLSLFQNNDEYTMYPYIIVEYGLSKYLDHSDLPSRYFRTHGTSIKVDDYNELTNNLNDLFLKKKLSTNQFAGEKKILDLYQNKLLIEDAVSAQSSNIHKEGIDRIILGYNALNDFLANTNTIIIEQNIYEEIYLPIINQLKNDINKSSKQLTYFVFINPVLEVLQKDYRDVNNSDLSKLHTYIDNTQEIIYLATTSFNSRVQTTITATENHTYNKNFSSLVNKILKSNSINTSSENTMNDIIMLQNSWQHCMLCQSKSINAEKHYTALINNQKEKRKKIQDVVNRSNELYASISSYLQKMSALVTLDTNNTLQLPINQISLDIEMMELNQKKQVLSNYLAKDNLSRNDNRQIDQLLKECEINIASLESQIQKKIQPFLNEHLYLLAIE